MTIEELEAKLETVTRERDEARAEVERLEVACHAWAEDMREAARLCEQAGNEMPIDAVRRFVSSKAAIVDMLQDRLSESRAEVERLMHQLADKTNESTHFQVMCKREGEEIERLTRQAELLTDERDELLVRVANQGAELRATREAYNGVRAELTRERIGIRPVDEVRSDAYRRGAEAMRDACAQWVADYCSFGRAAVVRALPIPEEP